MSGRGNAVGANEKAVHVVDESTPTVDTKGAIKRSVRDLLLEEADDSTLVPFDDDVRAGLEARARRLIKNEAAPLSSHEEDEMVQDVLDDLLGLGPIHTLMDDVTVTQIMVNGPQAIYVERAGGICRTDKKFRDESHLRRVVDRLLEQAGQQITPASPLIDADLPDGVHVHAVISPLAADGTALTIRKSCNVPFSAEDLIAFGTISEGLQDFLRACVMGRLNILIAGGSETGKSTLLNVVSSYVPADERIITVEETAELKLRQEHVVRLESRLPDLSGQGGVTTRDLFRNAGRMRPDRMIVGEIKGAEAFDIVQAISTGDDGLLATVNARSADDALRKLENMALLGAEGAPREAIREMIAGSIDLLVQLSRLRDGTRRVVRVSEVIDSGEGRTSIRDIFALGHTQGVGEDGRFRGALETTGVHPTFLTRLEEFGVSIPLEFFESE